MIEQARAQESEPGSTAGPGEDATARVGYCQECGRALTVDSLRRTGGGVFCEPCATVRPPGREWQPVNGNRYPGTASATAVPTATGEPNPVFGGILGLIPGVGAMYNGQYAKGAVHLIVFVVLLTMADNLNWVFYWLVWGWIFYQAFDAYHTARARRDRQPLPDPFGWNDIGERLGVRQGQPAAPEYPPSFTAQSRRAAPNWAGYVPPAAASPIPVDPYRDAPNQNPYTAPYATPQPQPVAPVQPPPTSVPYGPIFTGVGSPQLVPSPPAVARGRRFPAGALWLIVLGMLFLTGNLLPDLRLSGRWLVPVLLAALSFWIALRRWEVWRNSAALISSSASLAGAMAGPVMMLTVSVLLGFQAGHLVSLHRSWPVLLVVWGSMLLIQRSAAVWNPSVPVDMPAVAPPPPVRSTSGTGSLGL